MTLDNSDFHPIGDAEKALIGHVLGMNDFAGRDALLLQVPFLVHVAGSEFMQDLAVLAEIVRAPVASGPIPTRAIAVANDGRLVGEVLLWVTDGYLSTLEFAWYTDDRPEALPTPNQLVLPANPEPDYGEGQSLD